MGRSIHEDIIFRLKSEIISKLYSTFAMETPETGRFESIIFSFDIPYRESVGTILIRQAVSVGEKNRALEIEVKRKDIGATCCISLSLGTKDFIMGFLSVPNVSEYIEQMFKSASETLADRYDDVHEKEFNEIWNRET